VHILCYSYGFYRLNDSETTYVDLLDLEAFLEVVFFSLEALDEFVKFLRFLRQFAFVEATDLKRSNPLLEDGLLLRLQLFLRLPATLTIILRCIRNY